MTTSLLPEPRRATTLDTGEEILIWGADDNRFLVQDGDGQFRWEDHGRVVSSYRFDPAREANGMDGWHDVPDFTPAPQPDAYGSGDA